jgi:hypothetical protein
MAKRGIAGIALLVVILAAVVVVSRIPKAGHQAPAQVIADNEANDYLKHSAFGRLRVGMSEAVVIRIVGRPVSTQVNPWWVNEAAEYWAREQKVARPPYLTGALGDRQFLAMEDLMREPKFMCTYNAPGNIQVSVYFDSNRRLLSVGRPTHSY